MKIAVAASSGLIGSPLVAELTSAGHEVVRLVRRPASDDDEVGWDPVAGTVDLDALGPIDAAVNLAGAGVGDKRWTKSYKKEILQSRVLSTSTLSRALATLDPLPQVLVNGSAIGFYGDRGGELVDEDSAPGDGFLSDVVVD